ncbi:hypothetical protein ANN_24259 [Periplaneta americana]|uniref:Per a allergen n=1 Tax=Periplaneta americana TaxID=6978 RepID=A0ABQ8S2Z5_PERAM|nr:hypothetical protein ANN_24259 [Periplaneta americana]
MAGLCEGDIEPPGSLKATQSAKVRPADPELSSVADSIPAWTGYLVVFSFVFSNRKANVRYHIREEGNVIKLVTGPDEEEMAGVCTLKGTLSFRSTGGVEKTRSFAVRSKV